MLCKLKIYWGFCAIRYWQRCACIVKQIPSAATAWLELGEEGKSSIFSNIKLFVKLHIKNTFYSDAYKSISFSTYAFINVYWAK